MSTQAPTIPGVAPGEKRDLSRLSASEKRALLKKMLARAAPPERPAFDLLPAADRAKLPDGLEDAYPMTRMQAGMLFHSEYSSDSAIFHDLHSLRLRLPLDRERLRKALTELVERHQILRTSFDLVRFSQPLQLVHRRIELPLEIVRLGGTGQDFAFEEPAIERWLEEERQRAFDWTRPPLLQFQVHILSDGSFQFTLSFHHAILDGWSSASLLTELFQRYEAHLSGSVREMAPPEATMRDFVALEQQALASQECRNFWRRELAEWSFTHLPRWRGDAEPAQAAAVDVVTVPIPPEVERGIERVARHAGVPVKNVLLAAHLRVLSAVCGRLDVITGLSSHGRQAKAGGEEVLGVFLNILPFRLRLDGGTWRDLLERSFQAELRMRPHRRFPLAELQKSEGDQPLFETAFNFMHYHVYQTVAGSREGSETAQVLDWTSYEETNFTLLANFAQTPGTGELQLFLNYLTAELSRAQAVAIGGCYARVLTAIAEGPDDHYQTVGLLSPAQRQLLVQEWNAASTGIPRTESIAELFERQAARSPEAVALEWRRERMTYRQLDESSNQLAHYLRALGVGPEVMVALSLSRTPRLVVAILGVLKAGGAYVPLDAAYPRERLEYMLRDTAAPVLLCESGASDSVAPLEVRRVDLDRERPAIARQPSSSPGVASAPQQLAYVMYTSGSTGVPKGVAVRHRGVVRLVKDSDFAALGPAEVWLQLAPVSFDASTLEIWGALTNGARLVLYPEEKPSATELARTLAEGAVTSLWLTAGLFHQVAESAAAGLRPVRQLLAGGDVLSAPHVRKVLEAHPDLVLINGYGPTENTTFTCCHAMRSPTEVETPVSIGRAISATRVVLLDPAFEPVMLGATAELWTGGAGLARGYLNQPRATAVAFAPDPFAPVPGSRLYRTGDLARWRPAGHIEFLGRADHQVKVRGFRIELGEIETILGRHPAVRHAVVLTRQDRPGEKRLVAYLVPRPSIELPAAGGLRQFLAERLPDYMVPAFFVTLGELPLTPNGKLDRRALPVPEPERSDLEARFVAPRNDTERLLAEVWGNVMGIAEVGVEDDFFELGGDSILSLQISGQAQQRGLRVTSRQIFEQPNVAALAGVLTTTSRVEAEQGTVRGEAPLTPIQHWFFEHRLSRPHHWNQSILLTPNRPLDAAGLERAATALCAHHDALRLRFERDAGGWRQLHAEPDAASSVTRVDFSGVSEVAAAGQIERLAAQAQASLDLARGPLLRLVFMDGPTTAESRLLWVAHHLVIDGVSWQILLADFHTVYWRQEEGEAPALPPKTSSFKRWGERLVDYAASPEMRRELEYWRGLPWSRLRPVPVDFRSQAPAMTEASVESIQTVLDPHHTRALLHQTPGAFDARINDLLLAALGEALAPWVGRRPIVLDMEGHGREEIFADLDLTRTVGWFTSIFPVVLDPGERFEARQSVTAVRRRLELMPNHGLGFGVLRYLNQDPEIAPALRDLPPAEISFNYLGQMDQVLAGSTLLTGAGESPGPLHDLDGRRRYLIEINSLVLDGCLRITWGYSSGVHRRSTIRELADRYLEVLKMLIAEGRGGRVAAATRGDYPLAGLDSRALGRILESHAERGVDDVYPLSPLQKGMLFHSLYEPRSGLYVQHLTCLLRGELDVAAFTTAWRRVIERHATLRTSFAWKGIDEPRQVVERSVEHPILQLDWTRLAEREQQRELEALIADARRRGFELETAPLMRVVLARLSPGLERMIWTHHHLLLDGWSRSALIAELLYYYEALLLGETRELPLPRLLHDYMAWLESQDLDQARAFWQRSLANLTAPVSLGRDQGSASRAGAADHAEIVLRVPATTTRDLRSLVRRTRLTLNVLVQGAWALLLGRYGGQSDIVFGAVVSGRPASLDGAETMIGMLINTLPMRTRLDPDQPLLDWLRDFQSWQLESREYEYTPLVQIQGWAGVPRERSLFESIFVFENFPVQRSEASGAVSLEGDNFQVGGAVNYPLCATVVPGDQLAVTLRYHRSRFDPEMIRRMAADLEAILATMTQHPEDRLAVHMTGIRPEDEALMDAFNENLEDF